MTGARLSKWRRWQSPWPDFLRLHACQEIEDYRADPDEGEDFVDSIRSALEHDREFSIATEPL